MAIGRGCKKLRKVTYSDSYYMGDHSLIAIATWCFQLEALEISHCHNIRTIRLEVVSHSYR
uniref:F-box domain-containing protein n=1 Tax=Physcomitrium patens TaxID=3218 RepID=A0A2K1KEG4_PHYPA|nr:hypothetical protein PHYPA_008542 [Physcomitrium patens]